MNFRGLLLTPSSFMYDDNGYMLWLRFCLRSFAGASHCLEQLESAWQAATSAGVKATTEGCANVAVSSTACNAAEGFELRLIASTTKVWRYQVGRCRGCLTAAVVPTCSNMLLELCGEPGRLSSELHGAVVSDNQHREARAQCRLLGGVLNVGCPPDAELPTKEILKTVLKAVQPCSDIDLSATLAINGVLTTPLGTSRSEPHRA